MPYSLLQRCAKNSPLRLCRQGSPNNPVRRTEAEYFLQRMHTDVLGLSEPQGRISPATRCHPFMEPLGNTLACPRWKITRVVVQRNREIQIANEGLVAQVRAERNETRDFPKLVILSCIDFGGFRHDHSE